MKVRCILALLDSFNEGEVYFGALLDSSNEGEVYFGALLDSFNEGEVYFGALLDSFNKLAENVLGCGFLKGVCLVGVSGSRSSTSI